MPAQAQIRAQREELSDDYSKKHPMTLMRRLASLGLGLRAEEGKPAGANAASQKLHLGNSSTHPGTYCEDVVDIPALLRRRSS